MTVLVIGRGRAIVDSVTTAMSEHGIEGTGVTVDADAIAHLGGGDVDLLVIGGGVEPGSRSLLKKQAATHGVRVLETPLKGRDPGTYVLEEIVPLLNA
ncbi:hypothetical protein [Actinomadura litoris]|uniref:hypothetical protein n=1 Tax=Actinomadura litoris TaxID=2678616 RepID=UPI001FA7C655|nr:hypothetical protein [Actinomadura litoris]